jgi:hypothetical protein
MLEAKDDDDKVIVQVIILDDNAKLSEDPGDFERYRPTYKRRYDTKAEYNAERFAKLLRGEE